MNIKLLRLFNRKSNEIYFALKKDIEDITIILILQILVLLYRIYKACNKTNEEFKIMISQPQQPEISTIDRVISRNIENPANTIRIRNAILASLGKLTKKEIDILNSFKNEV